MFDQDLEIDLQSTLQGTLECKIKAMTTIVYSLGPERFVSDEVRSSKKYQSQTGDRGK